MPSAAIDWITPEWNAPAQIHAACTTRSGGVSSGGYASLNLATHVEDSPQAVEQNRRVLRQQLNLPAEPEWLEQTHSTRVINLAQQTTRTGDAAFTREAGQVAVVLTADCLPVLFCNTAGTEVAAAHAGWRGLLAGVLEQTVGAMQSEPAQILAWLGPAIGPQHFEVGNEVRAAFVQQDARATDSFQQNRPGHYLADLYRLARQRLKKHGIGAISGGNDCTYAEPERFFSYRRESKTGRQASLIWIDRG
jgi:YfiH family protein